MVTSRSRLSLEEQEAEQARVDEDIRPPSARDQPDQVGRAGRRHHRRGRDVPAVALMSDVSKFRRLSGSDTALLASAWMEFRGRGPMSSGADATGSTGRGTLRARLSSRCPRCEKPITVGAEIRRHRDFGGFVHHGCKTKPDPVERGTNTARPCSFGTVYRATAHRSLGRACADARLRNRGHRPGSAVIGG